MQICNTQNHGCKEKNTDFFTQFCTVENILLPENLPDIEQIISCVVDPETISIKTINTMKGLSYEGQYLTGKKVVMELRLKQKILYVSERSTQSVHVIENEFFQSVYIVIPCKIEGTDPEYLIKYKYLKPEITIENIYFKQTGKRSIFKNICMMVKLVLIPTHEICFSMQSNCSYSNLFMMHEDGANRIQITDAKTCKNIMPLWSPNGREIAYFSNCDGSRMLYVYCIKTCSIKKVTNPKLFRSITSFCWTADGRKLCFTGCVGQNKEIFISDVQRPLFKQLTFGKGIYSSCKPKCSPCGTKIAFLRFFSGIPDLWIMNMDGTECRKVTECGGVQYFDWSPDGKNIIYTCCKEGKTDELWIMGTMKYDSKPLKGCESVAKKRKLLYSPDNCHAAFIGTDSDSENIYVYNLEHCSVRSLTNYSSNAKISDITWNTDGSKIFFSANDLFHFNICSVSLNDCVKSQLTCTAASEMELSYRPQIS